MKIKIKLGIDDLKKLSDEKPIDIITIEDFNISQEQIDFAYSVCFTPDNGIYKFFKHPTYSGVGLLTKKLVFKNQEAKNEAVRYKLIGTHNVKCYRNMIHDNRYCENWTVYTKEVETFKPMYKLTEVEKSDVDKKYMDIIMSRLKEIKAKYFKENERNWMPDDVQKAWTAEYLELLDKCEAEKNEML